MAIRDGVDPTNDERNLAKQWCDPKDFRESHPNKVAEYAVTHKIDGTPAFASWVPCKLLVAILNGVDLTNNDNKLVEHQLSTDLNDAVTNC